MEGRCGGTAGNDGIAVGSADGSAERGKAVLSAEQTRLARHALGLPNKQKTSYRNRYIIGPGGDSFTNWIAMEAAGLAEQGHAPAIRENRIKAQDTDGNPLVSYYFCLTKAGARAALLPGEKLDKEDFPAVKR